MKNEELLRYERMYRAMREQLGTPRLLFDHPRGRMTDDAVAPGVESNSRPGTEARDGLQPPFEEPAPL